jgi:Family of unknown function (DUF6369)
MAPSGGMFTSITRSGIHFADMYFVGLAIALISRPRLRLGTIHWSISGFLLVFTIYFGAALLTGPADKYLIRELRVIVPLFWALLFRSATCYSGPPIGPVGLLWLGLMAGAMRLVYFLAVALQLIGSDDPYYQSTAYRYFDAGTYVCAAVLLVTGARPDAFRQCSRRLRICSSTLLWIALVVSGLRMLMVGVGLAWVLSARTWRRAVGRLVFLVLPALAFAIIVVLLDVQRVLAQTDQEGLAQSMLTRFGPAWPYLRDLDFDEILVGNGLRTLFEIPWFVYRSLDPIHNSVDSFYVTIFVKFGLMGTLCCLATIKAAQTSTEGAHRRAILTFLCLTMIVYSQVYLPHFSAFLVATQAAAMALYMGNRQPMLGRSAVGLQVATDDLARRVIP